MAQITKHEVLTALDEDILNAQLELQADQPTQFNAALLKILKEKNALGKEAARTHHRLNPDSTMHVEYLHFPLAIYQEIPKDFLEKLNARENFELYHKPGFDHAMVKFVYHF